MELDPYAHTEMTPQNTLQCVPVLNNAVRITRMSNKTSVRSCEHMSFPANRARRAPAVTQRELDSRTVISGLRGGASAPRTAPVNLSAPGHFGQQPGVHPGALRLFRAAALVCGEAEENYIRYIIIALT